MKASFPVAMFLVLICILAAIAKPTNEEAQYLSPGELAVSSNGQWLYVLCEKSDEVRVVDAGIGATDADGVRYDASLGVGSEQCIGCGGGVDDVNLFALA